MKAKNDQSVITERAAKEIFNDIDSPVCVKTFLNKYEHICAAINSKTVDDSYAYYVHCDRVNSAYFKMLEFILLAMKEADDVEIYLELQKVATLQRIRYLENLKGHMMEIDKLNQQFANSNGANTLVPQHQIYSKSHHDHN